MIHAELWTSESVGRLTRDQRLLFIGLFSNADDQGRFRAHPSVVRAAVFLWDDITLEQIHADLQALADGDFIILYEANGSQLLQVKNWWTYQKPQWAYPSKYPAPEGWQDRLRYRENGIICLENWCTPKGKRSGNGIPKDLPDDTPDDTPDPDTLRPSISIVQSSDSGSGSLDGADAPKQKLPQQATALALELYGPNVFSVEDLEALEKTEQTAGTLKTCEAVRWAHGKDIDKMRTICTTAQGWIVHKGNGSGGARAPPSEPSLMDQAKALLREECDGEQGRDTQTADDAAGSVARF